MWNGAGCNIGRGTGGGFYRSSPRVSTTRAEIGPARVLALLHRQYARLTSGSGLQPQGYDMRAVRTSLVLTAALSVAALLRTGLIGAQVSGSSMHPTLRGGDLVFGFRTPRCSGTFGVSIRRGLLPRGAVVLVRPPACGERLQIKRVAGISGDWWGTCRPASAPTNCRLQTDHVFLVGDAPLRPRSGGRGGVSVDSRSYGPCPSQAVVGRMLVWLRPSSGTCGLLGTVPPHHPVY